MLVELTEGLCQGRSLPKRGKEIILLVDGYDEIAEDERKRVSQALLLFASSESGHFYLTCRTFYDVFELKAQQCELAPFSRSDAALFIAAFSNASGFEIPAEPLLDRK